MKGELFQYTLKRFGGHAVGEPTVVYARTKSEARALIKHELKIPRRRSLPINTVIQRTGMASEAAIGGAA